MQLKFSISEKEKKFYKIRLIHVILFLLFLSVPAFGENIGEIKLVAFDYPPFYFEEDGKIQGIAPELLRELFGRMNIKTELTMYPLKRALFNLENGTEDALMILIKTAEREAYLHYTAPVIKVRGLIWSAADRKGGAVEFEKLEDLRHYTTGVTLGYSYGKEFDSILKTMKNIDSAPTDLQNYRKLLAHRIDIFPGNEIVAKGLFKKNSDLQGKLIHSQKAFIEWELNMGISKKSRLASLIPEINKILSDLKNEGVIDRAVRKYTE